MDNFYDSIADGYDELYGEEQIRKIMIIKDHLELKKGEKVLDVGCGTGISASISEDMTGIDPSSGLLKKASFRTVCAMAESIPFPDGSFDVVISITAIQNFKDIPLGLSEIKRVGKDCFVLTYLKRSKKKEEIEREIGKIFNVAVRIEEEKDIILFIGKRFK